MPVIFLCCWKHVFLEISVFLRWYPHNTPTDHWRYSSEAVQLTSRSIEEIQLIKSQRLLARWFGLHCSLNLCRRQCYSFMQCLSASMYLCFYLIHRSYSHIQNCLFSYFFFLKKIELYCSFRVTIYEKCQGVFLENANGYNNLLCRRRHIKS